MTTKATTIRVTDGQSEWIGGQDVLDYLETTPQTTHEHGGTEYDLDYQELCDETVSIGGEGCQVQVTEADRESLPHLGPCCGRWVLGGPS